MESPGNNSSKIKLAIGCVADNNNKFLDQALRLLKSWRWYALPYEKSDFYLCVVASLPAEYRKEYEKYGAIIKIVPRFSSQYPVCNKLCFLETEGLQQYDRVLLFDCDTIIVQNPGELISGDMFKAKIADGPTVPLNIFENLFSAFGLSMPEATERCTVKNNITIPYFNTGVLSFTRNNMIQLLPEWILLTKNLIEKIGVLEGRTHFCEQASFSLAMAKTRTPFVAIGNKMNFPAHHDTLPLDSDLANIDPVIIHYHWLVDEKGLLKSSPYPRVNERIEKFNSRLIKEAAAEDNVFGKNFKKVKNLITHYFQC